MSYANVFCFWTRCVCVQAIIVYIWEKKLLLWFIIVLVIVIAWLFLESKKQTNKKNLSEMYIVYEIERKEFCGFSNHS